MLCVIMVQAVALQIVYCLCFQREDQSRVSRTWLVALSVDSVFRKGDQGS